MIDRMCGPFRRPCRRSTTGLGVWSAVILCVICLAGTCAAGQRPPELPEAQWTLAFYLAGANSLEYEQERNLREIIAGAADLKQTHIVVFMDRDELLTRDNPLRSWKGTRVFHISGSTAQVPPSAVSLTLPPSIDAQRFERLILARLDNPQARALVSAAYTLTGSRYILGPLTADQRRDLLRLLTDTTDYLLPLSDGQMNLEAAAELTQRQFFCFVGDNFPARRYALFMAGHGSGWYAQDPLPDPTTQRQHPPEYFQILKGRTIADAARWQHFDLIVMDSCLMADAETLWTLRNAADYLVLNQIETPARGLDYTQLLKALAPQAPWSPRDLASSVVRSYAKAYADKPYPISTAAFETRRIEPLAHAWNRHFSATTDRSLQLGTLPAIAPVPTGTTLKQAMVDMDALCRALDMKPLKEALSGPQGVIIERFQHKTLQNGLSIYFPQDVNVFKRTFDAYRRTDWVQDFPEGWGWTMAQVFAEKVSGPLGGGGGAPTPKNPERSGKPDQ